MTNWSSEWSPDINWSISVISGWLSFTNHRLNPPLCCQPQEECPGLPGASDRCLAQRNLSGQLRSASPEWSIRDCTAIHALWLQTCQGVNDASENENIFSDTTKSKEKQPKSSSFSNQQEKLKKKKKKLSFCMLGFRDTTLCCFNRCVYTHQSWNKLYSALYFGARWFAKHLVFTYF